MSRGSSTLSDAPTAPVLMLCSLDSAERLLAFSFSLPAWNLTTSTSSSLRVGSPLFRARRLARESRRTRREGSERPYALVKTSANALSHWSFPSPGGAASGLKPMRGWSPTARTWTSALPRIVCSLRYSFLTSIIRQDFVLFVRASLRMRKVSFVFPEPVAP